MADLNPKPEKRNQSKDGPDDQPQRSDRRDYVLPPKESKRFEEYYQGQGLVPTEEWDDFLKQLKQPLPCTFRITGFKSHATEMLRIIKSDYLKDLVDTEVDNQKCTPVKCLSWYPNELGWQIDLERKLIRQDQTLKKLHRFLIQETESGNISRQEAVSMIPPILLDVQPNSKVLDMCAAPGSKTAQLIESLHADENVTEPDGFVMANDSDNKRCYLMVHQVNRLFSPNFAVTNMDASNLPNITSDVDGVKEVVKFDRILCDVPCSGDGTLRKNVDAWQRWTPAAAHGLHNLQMRILRRGLEMLEVGGKIVYSTCSFNPVENEAVIANTLKQMMGSVELVDVSDRLPGLIYEKGLHSWKIMSKNGEWFEKYEDIPERLSTQITRSAFPPSIEEAQNLNLQRCIRILPHKQDTGGFFVAVLVKKSTLKDAMNRQAAQEIDAESIADESSLEASDRTKSDSSAGKRPREDEDTSQPSFKKVRHFGYREDPFIFLKQDDQIWEPILNFYGISKDFPFSQLMVRCETGKKRNIYYVSPVIKRLVQQNEDKFKFINLGVKILSRSVSKGVECEFRLVQDGLHLLFPYITKRIVRITKNDIITMLSSENPYINRFSKPTQEQLNSLDQGGCVYVYEPNKELDGPECRLLICGWKGKVSCRSFLPKFERGHFLRLCGVELQEKSEIKSKNVDQPIPESETNVADAETRLDSELSVDKDEDVDDGLEEGFDDGLEEGLDDGPEEGLDDGLDDGDVVEDVEPEIKTSAADDLPVDGPEK